MVVDNGLQIEMHRIFAETLMVVKELSANKYLVE